VSLKNLVIYKSFGSCALYWKTCYSPV